MTEPDELLSKADALLARWRANPAAPSPPTDYPVLTDIVDAPSLDKTAPTPEIPQDPDMPVIDALMPGSLAQTDVPVLEPFEAPPLDPVIAAPASGKIFIPLTPLEDLPRLPELDGTDAARTPESQSLEDRIAFRVLDMIDPRLQARLDEPFRQRVAAFAQDLASQLSADARDEIASLVRDAVRTAVAEEIDARRNSPPNEA